MLTTFLHTRVAEIKKAEFTRRLKGQRETLAELRQLSDDRNVLKSLEQEVRENDLEIEALIKQAIG